MQLIEIPKLTIKEKETYLDAIENVKFAEDKAQPQKSARNRIIGKVAKARGALKKAVEPREVSINEPLCSNSIGSWAYITRITDVPVIRG